MLKEVAFNLERIKYYRLPVFAWYAVSTLLIVICSCGKSKTEFVFSELASGVTNNLNDIHFTDDTTGYVCGGERYEEGNIRKTTDGGETWLPQGEDLSKALNSIIFFGDDTGFSVGIDGKIFNTLNGGLNWNLHQLPRYQPMHDIFMVNEKRGFCCGGDGYKSGYIYNTTDGGENWQIDTFQHELMSLCFTSETIGYAAGYGAVFKTVNDGLSWELTGAAGDFFKSVFFTDEQTGFAVGYEGSIIKTSNAGETWENIRNGNNLLQETWHLEQIVFRNSAIGYIVGEKGCFLKTTDSGETWEAVKNAPAVNLYGICLAADGGFLCGEDGKIFRFLE
ncbi:MAG TPA: YCF48-related protein [Chitinophagales bacterium]|nr:YCF48-related protein [Chitinophagales bacterium]